jgi:cytochrome c oxidase assembly protein subunit 15
MAGMPPGTGYAAALVHHWRAWRVSPRTFQLVAAVAVWALVLTIVSGAAVRLTGSGLGCPDWPNCTRSDVVAPLQFHAWVEFGNRLINAAVTIASLGAMVAALRRAPRRRDLTWLSMGLVVGLVAEVGLGALVVDFRLAPGLVTAHFLLGMVFLADAVILHHRAGLPDQAGPTPASPATVPAKVWLVGRTPLLHARIQLAAAALAIALGTIVTSTGPHGGSPDTPRFHFSLHSVAQLHGTSVEVLLGVTLLTMWSLARSQAPPRVMRAAEIVLVAMVAQAAVGYTQYLNGDPAGLVALHVAGASILVVAILRFYLGLAAYPQTDMRPAPPSGDAEPSLLRTT